MFGGSSVLMNRMRSLTLVISKLPPIFDCLLDHAYSRHPLRQSVASSLPDLDCLMSLDSLVGSNFW